MILLPLLSRAGWATYGTVLAQYIRYNPEQCREQCDSDDSCSHYRFVGIAIT